MSKMDKEAIHEHQIRKNRSYYCQTERLIDLIGYDEVGYLSVDTEGSEYAILSDWLRQGGRAEAVTVEFNYDTKKMRRLCRLMDDYDMELDEVRGFDLCFLRKP